MSAIDLRPRKLATRRIEKVWGRSQLPAPFDPPGAEPIGEIWFEPPPELDSILVKYLFTSEKLSVQVHPSDEDARGGEQGKEECWLVLDAEPEAKLAIGFARPVTSQEIAAAAHDGSIEGLLQWHEVEAGDVFYLPAGTVHAIGPGISLVEIQQNSDTTFRLYDYGRPRELHLDRALAVAEGGPYATDNRSRIEDHASTLVDRSFFRIDRVEGAPNSTMCRDYDQPLLALPLSGELRWDHGGLARGGECVLAGSIEMLDFTHAGETLLTRPN